MHTIWIILLILFILGLLTTSITFIILYISSINNNNNTKTTINNTIKENENENEKNIISVSSQTSSIITKHEHDEYEHEHEKSELIPVTGLFLCIRSSHEYNPLIQTYITNIVKTCDFIEKIWILYPVHDMITTTKQVCDESSIVSYLYMNFECWQKFDATHIKSFFTKYIQQQPHHIWLICDSNHWFDPFVLQILVQGSYLKETLHTFQFYHYHYHLHWLDQQWYHTQNAQACFGHYEKTKSKSDIIIKEWSKAGWYLDQFDFHNDIDDETKWMLYRQQLRNGHEHSEWNYQGTCPYFFYETPFWFEPMDLKEWQKECDDPDRQIRLAAKAPPNIKLVPLRSRPMARRKSIQVPETLILVATQLNDADDQLEQNTVRQTWASRANQIPNVHTLFYHGFPLSLSKSNNSEDKEEHINTNKIPEIAKLMEPLWMEDEKHLFLPVAETWNENKPPIMWQEIQKLQMALKWSLKQFPHVEYILCTRLDQYIVVPLWLQMIQRLPGSNEHVLDGQVNLKHPTFMMLTPDQPTMIDFTLTLSRHLAEWFMNLKVEKDSSSTTSSITIFDLIYQVPCSWVHVPLLAIGNKFPSPLPLKYCYDCSNSESNHEKEQDQKDVRIMKLLLVHQQMKQAGYCR